jgi:hypothetical protein
VSCARVLFAVLVLPVPVLDALFPEDAPLLLPLDDPDADLLLDGVDAFATGFVAAGGDAGGAARAGTEGARTTPITPMATAVSGRLRRLFDPM